MRCRQLFFCIVHFMTYPSLSYMSLQPAHFCFLPLQPVHFCFVPLTTRSFLYILSQHVLAFCSLAVCFCSDYSRFPFTCRLFLFEYFQGLFLRMSDGKKASLHTRTFLYTSLRMFRLGLARCLCRLSCNWFYLVGIGLHPFSASLSYKIWCVQPCSSYTR